MLTHFGQGKHDLEALPVIVDGETILEGPKRELAGVSDKHNPATDSYCFVCFLTGDQVAPPLPNLGQRMRAVRIGQIRLDTGLQQRSPLILADRYLFGIAGLIIHNIAV